MPSLELLGTGIIMAWLALPLLARAARPHAEHEPAAAFRRILAALVLSAACLLLPWLRAQLPRFTDSLTPVTLSVQVMATPVGGRELGAFRGYAASPFGLLALAWGLGCAAAGTRWAVARLRLTRLLMRARRLPPPEAVRRTLAELARARGLATPRLLLSHDAPAPFSVGAWTPCIVLPATLSNELGPEQLKLVLRHELSHLQRRDPLTQALARLCTTLFAYHPTATRLMRELSIAREAAVDAEVAVDDRHAYASLLVRMASRVRFGQDPTYVAMDDTALARRIALLTEPTPPTPRPTAAPLLIAAAAIVGLGLFAPRVFAEPARFHTAALGMEDPMWGHETEVDQCYELARAENPELVISTRARFEVDPTTSRVTSAQVPTPQSATFQTCMEEKALTWSFPPPPGLPPPNIPEGASATVAVELEREP